MVHGSRKPAPLSFKPDLADAARHWNAFYAGEIIDRPVICVTAPRPGFERPPARRGYYDKVHTDIDEVITSALANAEATYWGGETVPTFSPSFGPDEISVFCGAELKWSKDSPDTNWSVPFVEDWEKALPLRIQEDHPLWQRMLTLCRRAAERMVGKMLVSSLDLHTNMDILAPIRGPQRLCMDLIDQPEMIDRAMAGARAIFPKVWGDIAKAARMDEFGYCHAIYSMEGAAVLQCDFSCMISPPMFRRWVLPALEEEARIVKHAMYHWDGPGALVHTEDLLRSEGLHSLSYVPGAGRGNHIDYLDLMKRVQAGGKAVQFGGNPDQIKQAHRELRPEKVAYFTATRAPDEAEQLLEWFVKNT
jgi:5-methyltetrahydrofolate--homocysteine methyltransferase